MSGFKRGQARPPHFLHLLLLVLHPLPQRLDLREQHHHQSHVLLDPLLQRHVVRQPQPQL